LNSVTDAVRHTAMVERLERERIDVTAGCSYVPPGHRHPLQSTIEEIVDIFAGLGYRVSEGPEIETDHYNFSALNIPEHHPARDMQDTFYLGGDRLLRTHTSPVQIRHLEANPPPVRVIAPGRVYRRDAVDATHSPVFHQVEVLALDEGLDFSHLRGTVTTFLQQFFGDLPVRFRASYFPFTEPSAEVDVQWRGRWLEVMGCGMVDPAVLEGLGIDPERWSGFAAGLGVERFCMVRHGIDDIRRLFSKEALLASDWYKQRLAIKQQRDIALYQRHVDYLTQFLAQAETRCEPDGIAHCEALLAEARGKLDEVSAPAYLESLWGSLGADWVHRQAA